MATSRNLGVLPGGRINGLQSRTARGGSERIVARTPASPLLFLGGGTYVAAYLLLGISGLTAFSGGLALAGTGLIVAGLRKTWERT